MTRKASEIAADLVAASQTVEWHQMRNTAGKSAAELAAMRVHWMEAERALYRLRAEEKAFTEGTKK